MTSLTRRGALYALLSASIDVSRTGAKTLSLKLIPHEGMMVGRILATDSKIVMLPYVLGLKRALA